MRSVIVGAHLRREDIEPLAEAMPVDDLFLSAIPVDDDHPLGDRDLLLRVAETRARLLDRATFIAIRYGFAVPGPAEAREKCASRLARWRELLHAHRHHVEMTLKAAAAQPRPRPDRHDFHSGAAYLHALHQAALAVHVEPAFRSAVENQLVPLTLKHRWIHRDGLSVELALLVARDNVDGIRKTGEELLRRFRDVPFLLSGPWPLEVFADDDQQ
jgi:hypothetical protein